MGYVYLDGISEIERRDRIRAHRDFPPGDRVFEDHFPGLPTVPGSVLLESITQAASALVDISEEFRWKSLPIQVDRVRYCRRVTHGERLEMEGRTAHWGTEVVQVDMVGRVDGRVAVEAGILFTFLPFEQAYATRDAQEGARAHFRNLLKGAAVRGFPGKEAVPS